MEFTKDKLTLEEGLKKEWIITNGIGGYSASTIIGANTRKYHGLLVAPLTPPARRYVILSKVDESIEIGNKKYELFTNVGKQFISEGFKNQQSFRKDFVPIYTYKVEDTEITKIICMEYGKNTVGIYYKIKNGKEKAKINLAPIVNFRDFHCVNNNHNFKIKQEVKNTKIKVIVDENSAHPIYIKVSDGQYIEHKDDQFNNMFYIEEEERGFLAEENHAVPGVFEIQINPEEEKEISFVCSLEENIDEINVKKLIDNEIIRLNKIFNESLLIDNREKNKTKKEIEKDELVKEYLIAADNFVVYRPSFRLHTLIAGYPWFLDWGRDSLISFEGILLIPKRFEIAKEVLLTYVRDIKFGLVPNGYSGFDNRPLYNSVDASLLLFEQIRKYIQYTNDYKFVEENIYSHLENIISNYINGIDVDDNNIYLDNDYLLVSGTENTQNTWMDAKCNGIAITPRNGKAVEINAMWYNALKIMQKLALKNNELEKSKKYEKMATKCKKSYQNQFYQLFLIYLFYLIYIYDQF